ncbi:programmed cell death 1 ligand 1-like, partial [Anabas testudineus]|uniref:programmed cell death 1 ligand 1-like n=1 Tax=Anabas testudineus TaxID=64144 RepID=UPI00143D970F
SSFSPSDQINLTAEPGDTVTLPCGVHSNISIIVVEWSRTDLETEYVFLQRGSRSESFNEHESFKNRVELKDREKKDGDVSLILRNVTFNDTGTYECRVVQRRTNHRKSFILETDPINIINLRVVEPEITAKPGEDVTLQCQGPRDEAVLMLRWTRADLTAEDGYVFFTREKHLSHEKYQHESYRGRVKLKDPEMKDGDVSVILKNVNINDAGTYECYVGYEGSYPKVFNSINLTVEPVSQCMLGVEDAQSMETSVKEELLHMLEDLGEEELKTFQWYLQNAKLPDGLQNIKKSKLEEADRRDTVNVMFQMYSGKVLEVIFQKMKRNKGQSQEVPPPHDPTQMISAEQVAGCFLKSTLTSLVFRARLFSEHQVSSFRTSSLYAASSPPRDESDHCGVISKLHYEVSVVGRTTVMGVETVQEGAQHAALSGANAHCAGGGQVGAKSHSLGPVCEEIFEPGT